MSLIACIGQSCKVIRQTVDTGSSDDNIVLWWRSHHRLRHICDKLGSRRWRNIVFEGGRVEAWNSEQMDRAWFLLSTNTVGQMGSLWWRRKVLSVRVNTG
jgi:hypothetical protein